MPSSPAIRLLSPPHKPRRKRGRRGRRRRKRRKRTRRKEEVERISRIAWKKGWFLFQARLSLVFVTSCHKNGTFLLLFPHTLPYILEEEKRKSENLSKFVTGKREAGEEEERKLFLKNLTGAQKESRRKLLCLTLPLPPGSACQKKGSKKFLQG